ncbi:MAG: isoprenylcysteine carboxylmethyltransferase family protein, partial [Maribacter sp.]|nr:isoprenylcysteine carboxylmethyltransferase family protein [Maribacter sp.]
MMFRALVLLYGLLAYFVALSTILYLIGFLGGHYVPKSINSGVPIPLDRALITNSILLGCFMLQHSIMARERFKLWFVNKLPAPLERSTFVLVSSLMIFLLLWQWEPIPNPVWAFNTPILSSLFKIVALCGWLFAFYSTFMLDHFHLFGLRQAYFYFRRKETKPVIFKIRGPYKLVRYPILLGYCIAFWSTPRMTIGHLLFSITMSILIFIGIYLKDREFRLRQPKKFLAYKQRAYT